MCCGTAASCGLGSIVEYAHLFLAAKCRKKQFNQGSWSILCLHFLRCI